MSVQFYPLEKGTIWRDERIEKLVPMYNFVDDQGRLIRPLRVEGSPRKLRFPEVGGGASSYFKPEIQALTAQSGSTSGYLLLLESARGMQPVARAASIPRCKECKTPVIPIRRGRATCPGCGVALRAKHGSNHLTALRTQSLGWGNAIHATWTTQYAMAGATPEIPGPKRLLKTEITLILPWMRATHARVGLTVHQVVQLSDQFGQIVGTPAKVRLGDLPVSNRQVLGERAALEELQRLLPAIAGDDLIEGTSRYLPIRSEVTDDDLDVLQNLPPTKMSEGLTPLMTLLQERGQGRPMTDGSLVLSGDLGAHRAVFAPDAIEITCLANEAGIHAAARARFLARFETGAPTC